MMTSQPPDTDEMFCSLVNALDEGFCVIEIIFDGGKRPIDYRFVELNSAFERQTGLANARGRTIRELAPAQEQHWIDTYAEVAIKGEPVRFTRRDEALHRTFDVHAFPIGEHLPALVGVLFSDVTQRLQAEAGLRERDEQLQLILESAVDYAIFVTDCERRIKRWNAGAERLTGYSHAEILGESADNLFTPEDRARQAPQREMTIAKETGRALNERWHMRKDGTRFWGSGIAFPLRAATGDFEGFLKIMRDRTAEQRAHEELERTVQERTGELRETVQQLETFSYSVVHDMRAPLRSLRSFAVILEEEYGQQLDDTARNYLARLRRSAEKMDALIMDVLAYSRVTSAEPHLVLVDVDELVREIVQEYPNFQEHARCVDIRSPLPAVLGNRALLTQCISNLLGNAVKFVPKGRSPHIVIRGETRGERARIWIEDNGIGIPAEFRERIFGLFQRLHSDQEYSGTGVGLAIVQKAVERMRGSVGFDSTPDQGTSFWIELPAPDQG